MDTLPRHIELTNGDAEILTSGNAQIVREPGSAFLIPFVFSSHDSAEAGLLEFLKVSDPDQYSCRYVRCAWFFVALFSKICEEMIRWHRHNSYLKLAEVWRDFIWARREKIYEDVRLRSIELLHADPWRADRSGSQSQKEAQSAAEALILQICRMTGERPASRGKIQVLVFFNDASVLGASEYPLVTTSHLFIHLPIMFLHITRREPEPPAENEDCHQDLAQYFRSEAFVPLPMDMPIEVRTSYLWEFLSGRMLWRAVYYDQQLDETTPRGAVSGLFGLDRAQDDIEMVVSPVDSDDETPPIERFAQTVSLRSPHRSNSFSSDQSQDMLLDVQPEVTSRSPVLDGKGALLQEIAHSLEDCVATKFPNTPIRLLDLLEMLLGPEEMSQLTKSSVTELPMFGYVYKNAWVHLTRILRSEETNDSLGTQLEGALSQRAALADSRRRIFIPVFSASSSLEAVRHEIATSAAVISFGDSCEDLDLGSLPDLLPQLVVKFQEEASPTPSAKLDTIRTSANGAFGYQITAFSAS
ncbi:hypothetical protein V5O48_011450 [Marasmius crinis-equi]|uniref:Uncharacterized protein n=1 Tax=Marasmius crinis-equi TaxID=585013 RepID=A0ABR3F5H6_9AGAR